MLKKEWKAYCPLMKGVCFNGFVKGMPETEAGERTTCAFFITLAGRDPQTDEVINDPGCSIAFGPIIQLEGNQHLRHAIASTDKVATEVRDHSEIFFRALNPETQDRVLTTPPLVPKLPEKLNGNGG